MMCGQTGSKYAFPFYIRCHFNVTTINLLESSWVHKILHALAASVGMFPLFLENSPFACIFAIFLNNILLKIKTFSISSKLFNSIGIGSNTKLLQITWHEISLSWRCLWKASQIYNFSSNDFTAGRYNSALRIWYLS